MRSKLDSTQIAQFTYDEVSEAVKVKLQDTEIAMELNAADGDNVTSHPAKLSASALGVASPADDGTEIIPPLDASSLSQVRVDIIGTGNIIVQASPVDAGNVWYVVGAQALIHNVCARRVRVMSTDAAGDVHLVGRS